MLVLEMPPSFVKLENLSASDIFSTIGQALQLRSLKNFNPALSGPPYFRSRTEVITVAVKFVTGSSLLLLFASNQDSGLLNGEFNGKRVESVPIGRIVYR